MMIAIDDFIIIYVWDLYRTRFKKHDVVNLRMKFTENLKDNMSLTNRKIVASDITPEFAAVCEGNQPTDRSESYILLKKE